MPDKHFEDQQKKLKSLLHQLELKIDCLADYGAVGKAFEEHVTGVMKKRTMTRNTACVVVALIFRNLDIGTIAIDDALEKIRRNDEDVQEFMKAYRVYPRKGQ